MTYRVPVDFITRVNGSDNDGRTSLKFNFGLKVFMDARHTVTVEEWGSLPPKTATYMPLKPLMDEVLFCKQEKSVRFRTGAPKILLKKC